MRRRAALLLVLSTAGLTGCAALAFSRQPDPRHQLEEGAAALEEQDWLRARGLLEPLYMQRWQEPVGQQALLAMIAAELDNRNPDRRLWAAAEMSARMLAISKAEKWMIPVASSYYLVAVELGAHEERARTDSVRLAEAEKAVRQLPTPATQSMPAQIRAAQSERDAARRRVSELETQLATRDRELRETRQELERIRATIRQ